MHKQLTGSRTDVEDWDGDTTDVDDPAVDDDCDDDGVQDDADDAWDSHDEPDDEKEWREHTGLKLKEKYSSNLMSWHNVSIHKNNNNLHCFDMHKMHVF